MLYLRGWLKPKLVYQFNSEARELILFRGLIRENQAYRLDTLTDMSRSIAVNSTKEDSISKFIDKFFKYTEAKTALSAHTTTLKGALDIITKDTSDSTSENTKTIDSMIRLFRVLQKKGIVS